MHVTSNAQNFSQAYYHYRFNHTLHVHVNSFLGTFISNSNICFPYNLILLTALRRKIITLTSKSLRIKRKVLSNELWRTIKLTKYIIRREINERAKRVANNGETYFRLQHTPVSCGNGDGNRHGHRTGQQHQQQQRLVPSTAPPPSAPTRGGIISGGNGPNCPSDSKPDAGSPLLSISEVTNTLLNQ